jgi:hypothetical protein
MLRSLRFAKFHSALRRQGRSANPPRRELRIAKRGLGPRLKIEYDLAHWFMGGLRLRPREERNG